jgi:hypothetical protein
MKAMGGMCRIAKTTLLTNVRLAKVLLQIALDE